MNLEEYIGKTVEVDWTKPVAGNKFNVFKYKGKVVAARNLLPSEPMLFLEGSPHTPIRVERCEII
jgi:hypothetical protein